MVYYHRHCDKKKPGFFGHEDNVDKNVKDSIDCYLEDTNINTKYHSELQKCVNLYIKKYEACNIGPIWRTTENSLLQYYPPGGGYHIWHFERSDAVAPFIYRHLVFITYLNDVNNGGETEFLYQKLKIKPETGLTIIFPPDWPFMHRGNVSLTEEKYIYTGWFNLIPDEQKYEH
jgi:hypothetical protein